MTEAPSSIFVGRHGQLGACAVQVALQAGMSGNAALIFGSMASLNGIAFWQLRKNLAELYRVSTRTITRYFRALSDSGLIVNKPAPLKVVPPGAKKAFPFRTWYKWVVGLPQIREQVRNGSKQTYQKWLENFEKQREQTANKVKFGKILGIINGKWQYKPKPRPDVVYDHPRRRWTVEELDAILKEQDPTYEPYVAPARPPPD